MLCWSCSCGHVVSKYPEPPLTFISVDTRQYTNRGSHHATRPPEQRTSRFSHAKTHGRVCESNHAAAALVLYFDGPPPGHHREGPACQVPVLFESVVMSECTLRVSPPPYPSSHRAAHQRAASTTLPHAALLRFAVLLFHGINKLIVLMVIAFGLVHLAR